MKFVIFKNLAEGAKNPNAWIALGKKLARDGTHNGYYLNVKFGSRKSIMMVNPYTFEEQQTPAHKCFRFMCRRINNVGSMKFFFGILNFGYFPEQIK